MSALQIENLRNWPANGHKLLLGMVHLKGDNREEILEIARIECKKYLDGGMDGVVVENYFGTFEDVRAALPVLKAEFPELLIGVDVIWDNDKSFDLALEFGLPFIQLDSAAGHLDPADEPAFEDRIAYFRANSDALIFGGVRFKNQPYLSNNDLDTDLAIAARRVDGVITTGTDTGVPANMDQVRTFRNSLGEFPLLIGSGVDVDNCLEQLAVVDGVIVGSSMKVGGVATGDVDLDRVTALVDRVRGEYPVGSGHKLPGEPQVLTVGVDDISRWGTAVVFKEGGSGVVTTLGDGWSDFKSADRISDGACNLAMTFVGGLPAQVTHMERHDHTREALFGAGNEICVAVCDGAEEYPLGSKTVVLRIPVGTALAMHRGTWHSACLGVTGPTGYYWIAVSEPSLPSEWIEIVAGPVPIEAFNG